MRKIIVGMKMSIDGKVEGPEGFADWVDGWSEDYGLTPRVDACLLGGGMYPGYEQYWTTIEEHPYDVHPLSGRAPTPGELEWARFASVTPHYVLSKTLSSARWDRTTFLRDVADVAVLKEQPGKDIYLMGGARITASLVDEGLVDELRLIVYPLIAGEGKALFGTTAGRRGLELQEVEQRGDGCVNLIYGTG